MRLALCQIDTVVGDVAGNTARILEAYQAAGRRGAGVVAVPELAVTGYPPRDLLEEPDFLAETASAVDHLVAATGEVALVFGAPRPRPPGAGKPLVNAAVFAAGGRVVGEAAKKLLPTYDVFDEERHFAPDPAPAEPVEFGGIRWGLHVCEDAWTEAAPHAYHRDPVAELVRAGSQVLLNISASPYHQGKGRWRRDLFEAHARRHGMPLLMVNLVGGNDDLIFDGESLVLDASGTLVGHGTPFAEDILLVEVTADSVRPVERGRDGAWSDPGPVDTLEPIESVRRALVLGLGDYAAKCGFRRAVVGLSGGIDSALTATLAADALGADNVWGVSLPSRYSSEGSLTDAEALARNLGIRYDVLSIEPVFEAALATLAETFAGTEPGIAEENLQARARGLLLMGLSNKFGHLLLTTGNKSEMAVGYSTLYGDMAGGLAVISDVPKTLVYGLSRYLNRSGERIPESTLTKPPSAELRPDQADTDSLPPYDVLDEMLEAIIEDRIGRAALLERGHPSELVDRVLRLVARAEYKRRQSPPGLRIRPKAFGLGRRMPIATPWRHG